MEVTENELRQAIEEKEESFLAFSVFGLPHH